jgi:hypothetical protein
MALISRLIYERKSDMGKPKKNEAIEQKHANKMDIAIVNKRKKEEFVRWHSPRYSYWSYSADENRQPLDLPHQSPLVATLQVQTDGREASQMYQIRVLRRHYHICQRRDVPVRYLSPRLLLKRRVWMHPYGLYRVCASSDYSPQIQQHLISGRRMYALVVAMVGRMRD